MEGEPGTDVRIERIGPPGRGSLFDEAVDAMAEAFMTDPIFEFLAPDEGVRRRLNELAFDGQLRLAIPEGHCYAAVEGEVGRERVLGATCIEPPGSRPKVRRLLPAFATYALEAGPILRGLPSMLRGILLGTSTKRLRPSGPHWYVAAVGVRPAAQGRGTARLLIERALDLARADRLPLALITESEELVRFYEHLGMTNVARERPLPKAPVIWAMMME